MAVDIFGSSGNTISSLYDDDIDFNYDGVDSGIDVTQITNAFLRRDDGNTATGDLNLDSHKIINLSEPISNTDAATKAYVDSKSGTQAIPNWALSEAVTAGQIRIYTDGQLYISNNTITANTPFAIGTTGSTWRAVRPITSYQSIDTNGGKFLCLVQQLIF